MYFCRDLFRPKQQNQTSKSCRKSELEKRFNYWNKRHSRRACSSDLNVPNLISSSDSEVRNVISLLPHDDKTLITSVAFCVCAWLDIFHIDFTCISWPSAYSDKWKVARLRDRCSLKVQDNDYTLTEMEKALHKLSGLHAHERIWPYLSASFSIASLTHALEL